MTSADDYFLWTPWQPLLRTSADTGIPRSPGLYRIRRNGRADIDYIGQTGLRLDQRLAMLRGAYAEDMPYRDPHTAAPALWALRHQTSCDFEVSVIPVEGPTPWRKGLEALAIGLYRQEHGHSPTIEFGRMPPGYRPSSGNNTRLARLGQRFRGGATGEKDLSSHLPGVPPASPLNDQFSGPGWNGHNWSEWKPLGELSRNVPNAGDGLYRLRDAEHNTIVYLGQGRIPERLLAHRAKMRIPEHRQGSIFATASSLECSWVVNDAWLPHQRLELENDLIAAYVLYTGEIPAAQFLG